MTTKRPTIIWRKSVKLKRYNLTDAATVTKNILVVLIFIVAFGFEMFDPGFKGTAPLASFLVLCLVWGAIDFLFFKVFRLNNNERMNDIRSITAQVITICLQVLLFIMMVRWESNKTGL